MKIMKMLILIEIKIILNYLIKFIFYKKKEYKNTFSIKTYRHSLKKLILKFKIMIIILMIKSIKHF